MASLREALTEGGWITSFGFVTIYPMPSGGSGNDLLYTSLARIAMELRGEWNPDDTDWWRDAIRKCEIDPGLYRRQPYGIGQSYAQESHDDLQGLGAADPEIAKQIAGYLESHSVKLRGITFSGWYNTVEPGTAWEPMGDNEKWSNRAAAKLTGAPVGKNRTQGAWRGRFPSLLAHLKFCYGEEPTFKERFMWATAIKDTANRKMPIGPDFHQDDWLLSALNVMKMKGYDPMCMRAVQEWRKRFKLAWPGGMKDVLARALPLGHPITVYWPDSAAVP